MVPLTAIVSAYFCAGYLRRRLENLRGCQVVVVCQRGSQEHTLTCAYAENQKNSQQIELVLTDGVPGVYEAWNLALRRYKTVSPGDNDYVVIANADDLFAEGALERMRTTLDEHPEVGLVYADHVRVDENGRRIGEFRWLEGGFRELLEHGCFIGCAPMWRRVLHQRYGYFDERYRICGDYEFWLRLSAGGVVFRRIPELLVVHTERPDSLEHRYELLKVWEDARIRADYRSKSDVFRA